MKFKFFFFVFSLVLFMNFVSSAHYITGYVNDAKDGEPANGKTVMLWNNENGFSDNVLDIVGPDGNSGASNVYLIDCELLDTPCIVGDILSLRIINNGDGYVSSEINVTVSTYSYDLAQNLSLNSIPIFENITVDDLLNITPDEIDLISNSTQKIFCRAVLLDYDGDNITDVSSVFYSPSYSVYSDADDNNYHYSNNSCFVNNSYGENLSEVVCSFDVYYYAFSAIWNCEINVSDFLSYGTGIDDTFINPLLSIGIADSVNFTNVSSNSVSDELEIEVTNLGNIDIDLNLYGYANEIGDGLAMNCERSGQTIPIYYKKYNLTSSNFGNMNLSDFENFYNNLTSEPVKNNFNLSLRENDLSNEAVKSTYWRIFVPGGIAGTCEGNIVFGAVMKE